MRLSTCHCFTGRRIPIKLPRPKDRLRGSIGVCLGGYFGSPAKAYDDSISGQVLLLKEGVADEKPKDGLDHQSI